MKMKLMYKNRSIEIDVETLGAMIFLGTAILKNDRLVSVLEKWLDGEDEIEVDKETFMDIVILYGVLKSGVRME